MSPSRSIYRLLLRLLPRRLRERRGAAMEEMFLEMLLQARRDRGRAAWARAWVAAGWDVVRRSVYERMRSLPSIKPRGGTMSGIGPDLRFALRGFVRQPGITLLVVLMLALGIGATTAVFSLANGLFFRPLPFPDPERLVYLNETAPQWNLEFTGISYADFVTWREGTRTFEAMGLIAQQNYNVSDGREAERIDGADVTHDLATALGIEPVLGRAFTAEEDRPGGPPVVLIGHDLWRRRFAGARDVLGRTLRINGVERTIVGVLPPEANFPFRVDLWVPLALDPVESEGSYSYDGIGRLRPGVTLEQARADLVRAHLPIWEERDSARVVSPRVMPLRERLVGDFRLITVALAAAVGLVLVIACANVASILLARSFARRRELGIRMAMGAGAGRLAGQLLTESVALTLVSAPLGLLLGLWSVRLLLKSLPEQMPTWMALQPDWRMGLFGLGLIAVTTALFGWAPMLQTRRDDLRSTLVEAGGRSSPSRSQRRTMQSLVVAEIALAALLMVGGGLLLRTFDRLRQVDPGFRTEDVLTFRVTLPDVTYPDSAARYGFYRELLTRSRALPGVRQAAAITCAPLGCHWGTFFTVEGAPARRSDDPNPVVLQRYATPEYFEAMGIRLLKGRFFGEAGTEAFPPVVINESFAREFFPGVTDPTGGRIRFAGDTTGHWYTVVGLAGDVKHYGLDEPMRPGVYFPLELRPQRSMSLVLWTGIPPGSLTAPIRSVVRRLDPELPLFQVRTTREAVQSSLAVRRSYSRVMAAFAAMALTLALGGIYGVLAYLVGQRDREIGIRVALGASRGRVVRLIVRQGVLMVALGLVLGLGAAAASGRLLEGLLFGVTARDPLTFAVVAAVLATVALLASYLPARRATRIEPVIALRAE